LFLILNSLALTHINYSFFIINSLSLTELKKLISKYNDLGSIIYKCYKNKLFSKQWINLKFIVEKNKYILLYKIIKLNHAEYRLKELKYNTNRRIQTRNNNVFIHKSTLNMKLKNSFSYWAPISWDCLPPLIRNSDNIYKFKHLLSRYLLTNN
jgi:hypothetical protein